MNKMDVSMGWTREQKDEWNRQWNAKRAQRKQTKSEKMVNDYQLRQAHDWDGEWIKHDKIGSARSFQKTHCKRCGVDYTIFKMSPVGCLEQKEELRL